MENQSIHPRVRNGRTVGNKSNTCSPRNPNRKGYLAKASAELDRRRRSHKETIETSRLCDSEMRNRIETGGYKQPASMNI